MAENPKPKPRMVPDRFGAYFWSSAVVGLIFALPYAFSSLAFARGFDGLVAVAVFVVLFLIIWFGMSIFTTPVVMLFAAPGAIATIVAGKRFGFRSLPYYLLCGSLTGLGAVGSFTLVTAFTLGPSGIVIGILLGALGGFIYWRRAGRYLEESGGAA